MDAAARITGISPQFLVDDLHKAISYYRENLGFTLDFCHQSFYASVSRDGFSIHLKCAAKNSAYRLQRKQDEHLDAYIRVTNCIELFEELRSRGATIIKELEERPWACRDFYVEDPDGYVLCFSEMLD